MAATTTDKPVSIQKRRTPGVKKPAEVRVKKPGADSLIPFLTLDEVPAETVPIKVFGKTYDMVAPQDMSPLRRHTVDQIWQRMIEIQVKVEEGIETTTEDELELEAATNRLVRMVVPDLESEVFDRLNWFQKEAIVEGFLAWKALKQQAAELHAQMRTEDAIQTGPK